MTSNTPNNNDNDDEQPHDDSTASESDSSAYGNMEQAADEFEKKAREYGELVGDALGTYGGQMLAGLHVFAATVAYTLLQYMPKSGDLADGLQKAGYNMKMKTTDADVICNVIYGDGVVIPRGATWQSKTSSYVTDNGEEFKAEGIGFNPKRMHGRVNVVWALRDSAEITEPLEGVIAKQRERGQYKGVRTQGGTADALVDVSPGSAGGGQAARTDGGQADGHVVSFRKGWQLFGSKVSQEDMQDQEKRGRLAEMDWSNRDQIKQVLIYLAFLALGMFGPALAKSIAGGGGSGMLGGMM